MIRPTDQIRIQKFRDPQHSTNYPFIANLRTLLLYSDLLYPAVPHFTYFSHSLADFVNNYKKFNNLHAVIKR